MKENGKNKKSFIGIAGITGGIAFALIAGFTGNPEWLYGLGAIIFIFVLDKYFVIPYHWRDRIQILVNKYPKRTSYILFFTFLTLIILIVMFRFI